MSKARDGGHKRIGDANTIGAVGTGLLRPSTVCRNPRRKLIAMTRSFFVNPRTACSVFPGVMAVETGKPPRVNL